MHYQRRTHKSRWRLAVSHIRIFSLFATLTLLGAGCFGGSSTTTGDGGIWRTTDFGENYEQLKALPQLSGVASIGGVNVRTLKVDPNDTSVYYIGTVANGMFYTVDYGTTWQRPEAPVMREGEILDIAVDPKNTCTLYVVKGRSLYKSVDCARSFEIIYTEGGAAQSLTRIAVDWYNPQIIWLGDTDGDLVKSINGGRDWVSSYRAQSPIYHIMVNNADSRIVLVGTGNRGLVRTEDTGASWYSLASDLNKAFPKSSEVFGLSQYYDGSVTIMNTGYGILHSEDAGKTWKAFTLVTSPAEVRIWDAAIDPKNRDRIYYTTYGKLFITENGGQTWRNVGLPSGRAPVILEPHPDNPQILLLGFRTVEE